MEDKLSPQQRIRLEALDQATFYCAGINPMSTHDVLNIAEYFRHYIEHGETGTFKGEPEHPVLRDELHSTFSGSADPNDPDLREAIELSKRRTKW